VASGGTVVWAEEQTSDLHSFGIPIYAGPVATNEGPLRLSAVAGEIRADGPAWLARMQLAADPTHRVVANGWRSALSTLRKVLRRLAPAHKRH